jgi:hypothetical protein
LVCHPMKGYLFAQTSTLNCAFPVTNRFAMVAK